MNRARRQLGQVGLCLGLCAGLSLGGLGCALFSSPSPTPSTPAPKPKPAPAPKPAPKTAVVADPGGRAAASPESKADWIERDGLRYLVRPRITKLPGGWGVKVEIDVQSTDKATHVVYGYSKGLAFSGVRFGNMNGMMPFSEGGKVTRHGRVRPGQKLVLSREYPGKSGDATGWTALKKGDSVVLSIKSWSSKGVDPVSNPKPVSIAGVTLTVDDQGKPTVGVEKSKE